MKKKKVLICVEHSDDETFGCAGTIINHVQNKDKVYALYMTDGVSSRNNKNREKQIALRKKNSLKVSKFLGFKWLNDYCGLFPDNQMDKVEILKIIKIIEKAKKKINPNIIYTHFPDDLNVDHRKVAEATLTAFRPQAGEVWEQILSFEVPSSTDYSYFKKNKIFNPNVIIDISKNWKKKIKALKFYKSEIKKFPNSRSIKGIEILAKYRGTQNGLKYAEAFQLIKEIQR